MKLRRALLLLAAPAVLLAGCASPADPGSAGDVVPGGAGQPSALAAPGVVVGQGTVLQKDGETPQFCLGPVAESYPPQCSGPEIVGWEWPADGMWENSGGVTWGAYAISGSWDGERFTVGEMTIPLALYDPIRPEPDPHADPANPGDNPDDLLARVQEELTAWTEQPVLSSYPENGYLWATVYYDDGSIQSSLDEVYGPDVVVVQSAFRDLPA